MHMFNVSTLYRQSLKLFHQKLGWGWSANEGTIYAYTQGKFDEFISPDKGLF